MRALSIYSTILIIGSIFLGSCTEVDFCDEEHPHKDKLVVKVNWNDIPDGVERPKELSLYLWKDGSFVTEPVPGSVDDKFIVDLPSEGNYEMMLLSSLNNCSLLDTEKYSTAKVSTGTNKSDASKVANSLFIVPLGNVQVKGNDAVIMNAKIIQGVRPVEFVLNLTNAAFLIEKAEISMKGNAQNLLLYKNEAVNVSPKDITSALKISASTLSANYNIFGGVKDPSVMQYINIHTYPKNGDYQTESIDITKYVNDFETKNPNKNVKLTILADGQATYTARGFKLVISSLSVDGNVVERGGNL